MARNASLSALVAVLLLSACGDASLPEPIGPTRAELLGVPSGADVYKDTDDAAEFDTHVDRYADMTCRTLDATIAALASRDRTPGGAGRRIATVGGVFLPGPAGQISRAVGDDIAAAGAARGNLRLSAAQAVRVAKDC